MRKTKIINPTFGSDPEFGVVDFNGNYKSIVGFLGGTKDNPLDIGNGCSRQEDNVNAEFCIPPVNTEDEFVNAINYCIHTGNEILEPNGLKLEAYSSRIYPDSELMSDIAKQFGCSPSYNAYTEEIMEKPCSDNPNLRSAGFHLHCGFEIDHNFQFEYIYDYIKYMDVYAGLPSLLLDDDVQRRELYGKAGDCRYKVLELDDDKEIIIIEYRTLGGNLLANEQLIRYMFNCMLNAIDAFNNNVELPNYDIETIINTSNIEMAKTIIQEMNIVIPESLINKKTIQYV